MADEKRKESKPVDIKILAILGLVCAIAAILAFFLFMNHKKSSAIIEEQNTKIQMLELSKSQLETEKLRLADELDSIQKRLENIKTLDDLLERDIKVYIKTHYKKVPRSVASEIASLTMKFGKQYKISPVLLVGIMQVESGFNPMITGPKTKYGNARGLMQVMPEWVKKFELKDVYDLYDIDTNIESGCKVFNIHKEEAKGSISKTLYKYVNGSDKYVQDVYKAMGKFVTFRSTIDTGIEEPVEQDEEEQEEVKKEIKDPKQ